MKRLVASIVLAAAACSAFATDVGVSISVGQPGFYGQINIGDYPPPVVVNRQPIIIDHGPAYIEAAPIYLRIPPGHRKHWDKHCYEYNACGRPVHFVDENWYNRVYVPQYARRHERERYDDHGPRREERWEEDHGGRHEERGRGYGRGHGRD